MWKQGTKREVGLDEYYEDSSLQAQLGRELKTLQARGSYHGSFRLRQLTSGPL